MFIGGLYLNHQPAKVNSTRFFPKKGKTFSCATQED